MGGTLANEMPAPGEAEQHRAAGFTARRSKVVSEPVNLACDRCGLPDAECTQVLVRPGKRAEFHGGTEVAL
jgi:hypothetical protein